MRRLLTVLLVACAALATAVTPASAHNVLTGSTPADGAELAAFPKAATLTFDQPVRAEFAKMALTLPDGASVPVTGIEVRGNKVIGALTAGPAGAYAIGYQIVSNDGHPVTGTIRFTVATGASAASPAVSPSAATGVTPPPSGEASPAPRIAGPADPVAVSGVPQTGGGSWVWGLLVVALALSGLGIAVVVRRPAAGGGHGA